MAVSSRRAPRVGVVDFLAVFEDHPRYVGDRVDLTAAVVRQLQAGLLAAPKPGTGR